MGWRMAHGSLEFLGASFPRAAVYFCEMIDVDSKVRGLGHLGYLGQGPTLCGTWPLRCVLKYQASTVHFLVILVIERERQATFCTFFFMVFLRRSTRSWDPRRSTVTGARSADARLGQRVTGKMQGEDQKTMSRSRCFKAYKCYWLRFLLLVINC